MLGVLLALMIGLAAQQTGVASDVTTLKIASPSVVAEIDTAKAEGVPVGLAWDSDGTIYLRVQGQNITRHYLITTSPQVSVAQAEETPAWAAKYWIWKSQMASPADPSLKIEVETHRERVRSTNENTGGDLAGLSGSIAGGSGGQGVGQEVAAKAALDSVMSDVITMRLKGHVVAEWANETPLPGMRIGWSPAPLQVLAYVDERARLSLIDSHGHARQVPKTSNVLLPSWSLDGQQIVYLERKDKHTYRLMKTTVR
jgi:hypothetical protein